MGRYAVQRDPRTGVRLRTPDGRDQSYALARDVPLEGHVRLRVERGADGRTAAPRTERPAGWRTCCPDSATRHGDVRPGDAYGTGGRDPYGGSPCGGSPYGGSSYDDEFDEAT
ncbi:hypothetical protein ACFQV4_14885 [Streptomyces thermocarboxydus]